MSKDNCKWYNDDNFELGGAITKGIKLLLVRSENGLVLDIRVESDMNFFKYVV